MSEIPFLNSITYQVIVNVLLAILLYCAVVMLSSRRADARWFGHVFIISLMLMTCIFNTMMIVGRCEVVDRPIYLKVKGEADAALDTAIRLYENKAKELKARELELNMLVEPMMKPMIAKKDIPALQELVDMLPRGYKGARRIYEAMLIIEEAKANENKKRR